MEISRKNIICIVQARMSSVRLPGKVLMPLAGKPVIGQVFHQLSFSGRISKIILATSDEITDRALVEWAAGNGSDYFTGSLNDVLDRFYQCAKKNKADVVVRITADCPLINPVIVDEVIKRYEECDFDYVSNVNPPTFPDGLDVEVFSFKALETAWTEAKMKSEREHVTLFIRNNPGEFKLSNYSGKTDYSNIRLTLDNQDDYKLLSIIYDNLNNESKFIDLPEVLNLLNTDNSLLNINKLYSRNEGLTKSLNNDEEIK